ncbi:STAGA complex 65 subunit gamma-like isoform X2 [Ornithodoros turicata]|uniref:STAGA complex 65 subunit gamma-like isoform X2 n=1 Tax=Ornithodoros turicata TaxID=34597 RepID=UPI0031398CD6
MPHQHWGDLPSIPDTESGIAAIEREQITKPRPVPIEGADLYQPSQRDELSFPLSPECSAIDPITGHTIALLQHAKKVQALLNIVQQQDKDIKPVEAEYLPDMPPEPKIPGLTEPRAAGMLDIKFEKPKSPYKAPTELSPDVNRAVLRRAVAVICAHIGYDTTESVLEVLTDVCNEFYQRLCLQLRVTVDREALTGQTGFVDSLEHALNECGIPGLNVLNQFFQDRILNYHKHMIKTCKLLHETYERVKVPQGSSSDDYRNVRVKEEPLSEIQFPTSDDLEEPSGDADEAALQLEELHGVLQTMEQSQTLKDEDSIKWPLQQPQRKDSTQSGTLEPDEEIVIVSDSPPLSSDMSIGSIVDNMEAAVEGGKLLRPPPFKKKKKM